MTALSLLDLFLEDILGCHSHWPLYLRGDANCNPNNTKRFSLLKLLLDKHDLISVDFHHPSHHHFVGKGMYDAQIDVLIYRRGFPPDTLDNIVCKLEHPLVNSAHDLILSSHSSLPEKSANHDRSENIEAIRVKNDRIKIIWNDDNID